MDGMDRNRELAILLLSRLERLSADSYWAHQASGLRGSLLRVLEEAEFATKKGGTMPELSGLIHRGFELLERGAREVG